jgi:nucleoside 2-deoxyribosyltransferase
MERRFYLSTQKDRNAEATPLLEALKEKGWERTFDWAKREETEYANLAIAEIAGIQNADVVIVILPGGRGTHVEIGAALALGKPIILHAPNSKVLESPYPCAFHYHPAVKIIVSERLDVAKVLTLLPEARQSI